LIVDDEVLSLQTLRRTLDEEYDIETATSAVQAQEILEREWVQVVLCDQRMPEVTGVEFLTSVREQWPEVIRIIISGYTDAADIIQGINDAGIYQYITKPWHPDNLLLIVRNAVRLFRLQRENELLSIEMKVTVPAMENRLREQRAHLKRNYQIEGVVRSPESPIHAVCNQIEQVAPYDISILLTGESGTGKELFARALHYNSLRSDKPFVVENCGALPDELLESELFGHKKGAFTGAIGDRIGLLEQADGGTVFLDEIGDVSPAFQVKLLRFLQEGEIRALGSNQRRTVDVRVVAATNRNLEEEVRNGRFREDLYYRFAAMTIHLPALRERLIDIPLLATTLLQNIMRSFGKDVRGFTEEALDCMQNYHWPGNVRELQNEIQRMLVLATDDLLGASLLSPRVLRGEPASESLVMESSTEGLTGSLKNRVEALEASILRETLIRHRWNKSRAAEELGLSRVGLRSKLERYGLEPKLNS